MNKYLTEADLKIDKTILAAIEDAGFKIDKKAYPDMTMELGATEKTIKVNGQDRRGGVAIRMLLPDLTDPQLNVILGNMKATIAKKKPKKEGEGIQIVDNVSQAYDRAYKDNHVSSCMVRQHNLTKFYDKNPNIQAVIYVENGRWMSRALLWNGVMDSNGKEYNYLDRIYPSDDKYIRIYHDYAKKQGWIYRDSNRADTNSLSAVGQIFFDVDFSEPIKFPYMDTMVYAYPSEGFITNRDAKGAKGESHYLTSTEGVYVEPVGFALNKLLKIYRKSEVVNSEGIIEIHTNVDLSKQNIDEIPEYFADKIIVGDFTIIRSGITSLENSPRVVIGNFDVFFNKNLQSLEGGPEYVDGHYRAYGCDLRNLNGVPTKIGRSFNVSKNKHLSSLEGGPEEVGGRYWAHTCNLRSLEGIAKIITSNADDTIRVDNNPINFTKTDIRNAMTGAFDKQRDVDFYSDEAFNIEEKYNIADIYADILNG